MVCFSEMYRNVMKYLLVKEGILHIMSSSCIDNNAQYIGSFRLKPTQKQVCSGNTCSVEKMNDDQCVFPMGKDWGSIKTIQKMVGKDDGGKADTQQTWRKWTYIMHKGAPRSLSTKSEPNTCIYMIYHTSKYPYAYIYIYDTFIYLRFWYDTPYIYIIYIIHTIMYYRLGRTSLEKQLPSNCI